MRTVKSVGVVLLLLAAVGAILMAGAPPSDDTQQAKMKDIFTPLVEPGEPGLAVLVERNGKILFEKGYGVRKLGSPALIDLQTNFRLASVTKQFTAMAIMLLVHDGKLHYDDHLTDFFSDFPRYGRDITIRNLLNHTSGLPDYSELMEKQEKNGGPKWSPEHQIQDDEVLALLKAQPVGRFAPGARWEYSNSGYVVLGLIVAKVSRMPYREFLQRRIFAVLKMNKTVVYQDGKNTVSDRAFGHSRENGKLVESDQSPTSATLGDGGIYSNVPDLAKWDQGLQRHTLLGESEMRPALTPVQLNDGSEPHWPRDPQAPNSAEPPPVKYGFGWFLDPYQSHARNYHDGGTMGFRTTIQRFIDDHLAIVVLCNRTDLNPDELSLKVADILLPTGTH
jgi:CubicO group peptidase (beta-lactamase class C family)